MAKITVDVDQWIYDFIRANATLNECSVEDFVKGELLGALACAADYWIGILEAEKAKCGR